MKRINKKYLPSCRRISPTSLVALALFGTYFMNAQNYVERQVGAFNKIETSGIVNVYYTHSDTSALKIYASAKDLEDIETKVENSKLTISNKGGKFNETVKVYVKNNALISVESSGASSFKTLNALKSDSLNISLSGSANVKIQSESRTINTFQSGATQLNLSGTSTNFQSELSGASSLSAYGLVCDNVKVVVTGASTAKIFSNKKVHATAAGASSIKIKGEAKDISAEASPASSITRIVDKKENGEQLNGDSVIYNWKGKKIIIIDKENEKGNKTYTHNDDDYFDGYRHWAGFSMGVNGFMDANNNVDIASPYQYMNLDYSKSFNYQFNLFENHIKLYKNKLVLVTGFGFDYHSYQLENKTRLNADSSFTGGVIDSSDVYGYRKNRLRNTYIQVPLLLEFNTKGKNFKCFHMAVGVVGGFQICSRTKQVLIKDGYEIENVRKDSYNTNPFIAKAHVNMGYGRWTFFGEYNLTPLFQHNKGPVLYPFSVGLRIVPFG